MMKRFSSCSLVAQAALFVLGGCMAVPVMAQMRTPLIMAPLGQLTDERGKVLQGNSSNPGDLVVTYQAVDGVVHPPNPDGSPHANNRPVPGGTTGVGWMMPPNLRNPGVFNLAIVQKGHNQAYIREGSRVFVRVFNASTLKKASFYTDSQLFRVEQGARYRLVFPTSSTDQPLDPRDDDRDGLNNSWERSLNTNMNNPDTDGDGMLDGAEFIAGTDGRDRTSLLEISSMFCLEGDRLYLSWQSVSGKTYHVQANAFLTDTNGFVDIPNCTVISTSDESRILIPDQFQENFYNYRVVVRPEE